MKKEDLFEAIGGVEDALLEENVVPAEKRRIWPTIAGLAACAAAVVFAVRFLPGRMPVQPGQELIEMTMTAETYNAAPAGTETILTAGEEVAETLSPAYESETPYPGIWYVKGLGTDEEAFCCFREDGTGAFVNAKTGTRTDFAYEVTSTFSGLFGSALHFDFGEESSRWTEAGFNIVTDKGAPCAYLSWDPTGESVRMQYVCEGDFDSFTFYTDEELCEIVGKLHGLDGSAYECAKYNLVPSARFPKVVVSLTAGEWQGHWYYIADRLTGEAVRTDQIVMP